MCDGFERNFTHVDNGYHGHIQVSRIQFLHMHLVHPELLEETRFYDYGTRFEEDVEYNRIVLAFPELFCTDCINHAHAMLKYYHTDIYYSYVLRMSKLARAFFGHSFKAYCLIKQSMAEELRHLHEEIVALETKEDGSLKKPFYQWGGRHTKEEILLWFYEKFEGLTL